MAAIVISALAVGAVPAWLPKPDRRVDVARFVVFPPEKTSFVLAAGPGSRRGGAVGTISRDGKKLVSVRFYQCPVARHSQVRA